MSDDVDERTQLLELRQTYQRNLAIVEKQRASYGDLNVPVHILNQISEYESKIAQIDRQLKALNPMVDDELRTQALVAYAIAEVDEFRNDLSHVANLLSQIVKADPNDEISHDQLATIRRYQQFQRDYAAINQVRNAGNWKAVELLLTKLAQRAPDFPDPEGHWEWVKQEKIPLYVRENLPLLQNPDPSIPLQQRLKAAETLGKLGDPRRGVCNLDIDWCDVLAGTYVVGESNEEQTVILPAFKISKYCVTNAQWRLFMNAGGYRERRWWGQYWLMCHEGWDWVDSKWQATNKPWRQPHFWTNADFNQANQPVMGVSWYEATVFCTWLSEQLGYYVALPTEAQWGVAARGIQCSIYPWGNQWNADYANTSETGLKRATPVGCYPHGTSWCDALDMCGNVWEWTVSDYTKADRMNHIDIVSNSTYVSIHGGTWDNDPLYARSACRFRHSPLGRNDNLGIRLVCEE